MFISPVSAIATTLITSVGFLFSLSVVVALRALSHIFFVIEMCIRDRAKGQERKNENEASLLENIREVCHQLADNERWFQMECNGDLIDACIFQREALMARYRYLLALARQQGDVYKRQPVSRRATPISRRLCRFGEKF